VLTATAAATTDYNAATTTVPINVNPAALTITADDAGVGLGGAIPSFTAHYAGFVNHDTPAVLAGRLAFSAALVGTRPGVGLTFAVTPLGVTSRDYTITFDVGHLSVPFISVILLPATAAAAGGPGTPAAEPGEAPARANAPVSPGLATALVSAVGLSGGGGQAPAEGSEVDDASGAGASVGTAPGTPPAHASGPAHAAAASGPVAAAAFAAEATRGGVRRRDLRADDDQDEDEIFVVLGVGPLYRPRDLFGELIGAPQPPDNASPPADEDFFDTDPATLTLTWFVLATVASELALIRQVSSSAS
jgi:hypothetical protein